MARSPRAPVLLLALAGIVLLILCLVGVVVGLSFAEQIHALLPPVQIDAAAVGGAAVAFGVASGLLGAAHLGIAIGLRRGQPRAIVPAIVLAATMSVVALGWAVAALVSFSSQTGIVALMLPAGIGLVLVSVGYGWVAGVLIGLRRPDQTD